MPLPDFILYCICDRLSDKTINTILESVLHTPSYILFDSKLFHYELDNVHVASSSLDDTLRVKEKFGPLRIFSMDVTLVTHPCCSTVILAVRPDQHVIAPMPKDFILTEIKKEDLTPPSADGDSLTYVLHFYKTSNEEEIYFVNLAKRLMLFPPRLNRSPIPSRSLIGQTLRFTLSESGRRILPLMTTRKTDYKSILDQTLRDKEEITPIIERLWANPFDRNLVTSISGCIFHFITSFDMKLNCIVNVPSVDIIDSIPYIARYAALTHIVSHMTNLEAGEMVLHLSDVHVRQDSVEEVRSVVINTARIFPTFIVKSTDGSIELEVQKYYPR